MKKFIVFSVLLVLCFAAECSAFTFPRVPFQKSFNLQIEESSSAAWASFTVPAKYRLVIEMVSLEGALPMEEDQQLISWAIQTQSGNESMSHGLSISPGVSVPSFNGRWYSIGLQVRLYADPGSTVKVCLVRCPYVDMNAAGFVGFVSGYLVPVGSPSLAP